MYKLDREKENEFLEWKNRNEDEKKGLKDEMDVLREDLRYVHMCMHLKM